MAISASTIRLPESRWVGKHSFSHCLSGNMRRDVFVARGSRKGAKLLIYSGVTHLVNNNLSTN